MLKRLSPALLLLSAGICSSATAQIESILTSDGAIPFRPGETIWPTFGIYRFTFSSDLSKWAIRVNATSGNDDEYIIVGEGAEATDL
ncbi:MAG: hypothetical protein AAGB34_10470, partial [Planctomycetota bacterium]